MMPDETMTSRERVLAAINHREADRVPIDLGGFQTGIHRDAYADLVAHLGLSEPLEIRDPVQQLAAPSEEVLRRFHVDTRYVFAGAASGYEGAIEHNERDGRLWHDLEDEFGVVWSMPDGGKYMDISHHPLADATIADLDHHPWPDGSDPARFQGLRLRASEAGLGEQYAVCTGIGGVIYEYGWYLRGLERWLVDLVENPDFCAAVLDRMLAYWTDFYTGFLGAAGDAIDVVMIGDDLAGQYGPLFSPRIYREIVQPRHASLVRHIRGLTDAKVWYHTCGDCVEYIDDLIDNGVDILNPVQISTEGMVPAELKKRFGHRIVFWGGGIDSQHVLPFAEPGKVRAQVKANVEAFKPGGGYVFNNVHNIQAGVPAENIVALHESAYEAGFYE
jgi:uroporphyrinogen decarboxylase